MGVVYVLENRGYHFLFHWVVFMLGGLRHIPKNEDGTAVQMYCSTPDAQAYHRESLELIRDAYQILPELPKDVPTQNNYGEPLIRNDFVNGDTYRFLRELYLSRLPATPFNVKRKIYISRSDSMTSNPANKGRKIRHILNETELCAELQTLGFETIVLSELSFQDKIKLFQSAGIIISPHGSGLVFSLFANPQCLIIEILPDGINDHNHYKLMCEELQIPYHRFSDVTVEGSHPDLSSEWNMKISIPAVKTFLTPFL